MCICGYWGEGVYVAECKGGSFYRKKASVPQARSATRTIQTELLEAAIVQGGSQQLGCLAALLSFPSPPSSPSWGRGPYPPPPSLTWD